MNNLREILELGGPSMQKYLKPLAVKITGEPEPDPDHEPYQVVYEADFLARGKVRAIYDEEAEII